MTTITALPTPVPSRDSPTTFAARADAFLTALPNFGTEINLVVSEVNATAVASAASAVSSAVQAAASLASQYASSAASEVAVNASGAAKWVNPHSYNVGDAAWSPATGYVYRCYTATSANTDPAYAPGYWMLAGTSMPQMVIESSIAITMTANMHVVLTNVAASKAKLPATPGIGSVCAVTTANGLATNSIGYNATGDARTIMGVAEDLILDSLYCTVWLRYVNPELGWRVV